VVGKITLRRLCFNMAPISLRLLPYVHRQAISASIACRTNAHANQRAFTIARYQHLPGPYTDVQTA
jgi:hypothetical protein